MRNSDITARYNYDEFIPSKFEPWDNFEASPPLGTAAPDFPLWDLEERQTSLTSVWFRHTYTVVEFGSLT